MGKIVRLCTILVAALLAQTALGQQHAHSIEDFGFLQGYWQGTGFGGQSEEMWMPPVDGRMFGIFKQSQNSKLMFTEFMEIVAVDGSFILRLKHFNPDFTGWEEKGDSVIFRLSTLTDNNAVFGGLSYELVAPNALQVKLNMRNIDGNTVTEVFDFIRTGPLSSRQR